MELTRLRTLSRCRLKEQGSRPKEEILSRPRLNKVKGDESEKLRSKDPREKKLRVDGSISRSCLMSHKRVNDTGLSRSRLNRTEVVEGLSRLRANWLTEGKGAELTT